MSEAQTTITISNINQIFRKAKREIQKTHWIIPEEHLRRFARGAGYILVRRGDNYSLRAMTKRKPKPKGY